MTGLPHLKSFFFRYYDFNRAQDRCMFIFQVVCGPSWVTSTQSVRDEVQDDIHVRHWLIPVIDKSINACTQAVLFVVSLSQSESVLRLLGAQVGPVFLSLRDSTTLMHYRALIEIEFRKAGKMIAQNHAASCQRPGRDV